MEESCQCQLCNESFSTIYRLISHLKRKKPCTPHAIIRRQELIKDLALKYKIKTQSAISTCPHCLKNFSRKDSLSVHLFSGACIELRKQLINKSN